MSAEKIIVRVPLDRLASLRSSVFWEHQQLKSADVNRPYLRESMPAQMAHDSTLIQVRSGSTKFLQRLFELTGELRHRYCAR